MKTLSRILSYSVISLLVIGIRDISAEDLDNRDVVDKATVYDDIVIHYLLNITPERFPEEFKDLKKHPSDMIHSPVTAAVAQSFTIFCLREGFREDTPLHRGYRIAIGRFLSRIEKGHLELILKRGFGLDQREKDNFRFGIHYFKGDPPKDLSKKVEEFLELRPKN